MSSPSQAASLSSFNCSRTLDKTFPPSQSTRRDFGEGVAVLQGRLVVAESGLPRRLSQLTAIVSSMKVDLQDMRAKSHPESEIQKLEAGISELQITILNLHHSHALISHPHVVLGTEVGKLLEACHSLHAQLAALKNKTLERIETVSPLDSELTIWNSMGDLSKELKVIQDQYSTLATQYFQIGIKVEKEIEATQIKLAAEKTKVSSTDILNKGSQENGDDFLILQEALQNLKAKWVDLNLEVIKIDNSIKYLTQIFFAGPNLLILASKIKSLSIRVESLKKSSHEHSLEESLKQIHTCSFIEKELAELKEQKKEIHDNFEAFLKEYKLLIQNKTFINADASKRAASVQSSIQVTIEDFSNSAIAEHQKLYHQLVAKWNDLCLLEKKAEDDIEIVKLKQSHLPQLHFIHSSIKTLAADLREVRKGATEKDQHLHALTKTKLSLDLLIDFISQDEFKLSELPQEYQKEIAPTETALLQLKSDKGKNFKGMVVELLQLPLSRFEQYHLSLSTTKTIIEEESHRVLIRQKSEVQFSQHSIDKEQLVASLSTLLNECIQLFGKLKEEMDFVNYTCEHYKGEDYPNFTKAYSTKMMHKYTHNLPNYAKITPKRPTATFPL